MYVLCCGRYQPFHNGHLHLLREAATRGGTLVVGAIIATPTPLSGTLGTSDMRAIGDRRLDPSLNPFTLVERMRMITGAIADEPWAGSAIVTPMPRPDVYWELVEAMFPGERVWVLQAHDDPFEAAKEQFYQSRGDAVLRLTTTYHTSGTRFRELLATDRERAFSLVPAAVARVVIGQ
jgi:cytidyltransferase-like protein